MALSTRVKVSLNSLLKPIRLQINTTVVEEQEAVRLHRLQERGHWQRPRYDQGLEFDEGKYLRFLHEICAGYREGYGALPEEKDGSADGYYLHNDWFGPVDAEVLYAMVRHFRPRRILEIGSGFSTRLARRAIGDGRLKTQVTCIDPAPRVPIERYANDHIATVVEALPAGEVASQLEENDILFIDSSHRVVSGGDVPFLFLEVLPQLRRNVLIHVHDIFFPFEYPERQVMNDRAGWSEQYLVHAFLAYNQAFEILWPGSYMWERKREQVREYIPAAAVRVPPSSLWLRKVN